MYRCVIQLPVSWTHWHFRQRCLLVLYIVRHQDFDNNDSNRG